MRKETQMSTTPSKNIDVFDNPYPNRNYWINIDSPEFTCLCPKTGQPDFATIHISYIPDEKCIELKSLKLYLWSYREEGAFHEAVTNKILDDIVGVCQPREIKVTGSFLARGGITTSVVVTWNKNEK